LLDLSKLHIEATPKAKNVDLLAIFEEKILDQLFGNLVEGNDEESIQIFAKYANKYADLAILAFHSYAEIIQNDKSFENMSEQRIKALWTLIRSLEDEFTFALEKSFFGKGITQTNKNINAKRKNPYAGTEETKEEESSASSELAKQYKKSNFFSLRNSE